MYTDTVAAAVARATADNAACDVVFMVGMMIRFFEERS
jgi:hypothetical protein